MGSHRIRRVNELLKQEIALILERRDLRSGACLVSVTGVDTSPDLRHAKVGISILGGEEDDRSSILRSIKDARKDIQTEMSKNVILKYTPVLEFFLDSSIERGDKLLAIIEELEADEDVVAPDNLDDLPHG